MTERYAGAGSASFEKVYVLGNINQTGWAPNNGIEMTTTNGEKYTATIDFVDPYGGYSYFSFSTALATNADDWDAIASCRMGATSKDQLISQSQLGQELNVVAGQNAFRIATGKYNLTLYLTGGKLVVEKWTPEPQVVRGDVDMDGEVNVGDITALIDWMLGNHTMPVSTTNADTDLDGVLTIGDVTRLIDYMLNGRW